MCVLVHVCIVCVYECMCVRMSACGGVCACVYECVYECMLYEVCMCACVYECVYECMCVVCVHACVRV